MMEDRNRGYTQEFKTVSNRSRMLFTFKDGSDLIGYQLEMLKNNQIPSLLKCEVLKVDHEIRISFDVTSMLPLHKILERKVIGRREFFQYLRQIAGVFDQLENHLLDYGGVMLDSSLIYGSPSDDRIFLIYIPRADMDQDIHESLRQFITNLIIKEMKFRNEHTDNYIQRLIEVLKAPDFNLGTLKSWLESFPHDQNEGRSTLSHPQPLCQPSPPTHPGHSLPVSSMPFQPKMPDSQGAYSKTITEKKRVYPLKSWLVLGSAVTGILALFAVMVLKGSFEPGNPDTLTTLIGLVLISGAVIWLVCSKVFATDRKVGKVVEKKIQVPETKAGTQTMTTADHEYAPQKVEYVNKSIPRTVSQEQLQEKKHAFSEAASASDRTVLLAEKGHAIPSITRLGGDEETVMIRQWPFRIGRMAEQVDFCIRNPAVGRIHAELTKGPHGYCITDMNTRNGTFIDGNRIEPNMEQSIKGGDRFMLANEEFLFSE